MLNALCQRLRSRRAGSKNVAFLDNDRLVASGINCWTGTVWTNLYDAVNGDVASIRRYYATREVDIRMNGERFKYIDKWTWKIESNSIYGVRFLFALGRSKPCIAKAWELFEL